MKEPPPPPPPPPLDDPASEADPLERNLMAAGRVPNPSRAVKARIATAVLRRIAAEEPDAAEAEQPGAPAQGAAPAGKKSAG